MVIRHSVLILDYCVNYGELAACRSLLSRMELGIRSYIDVWSVRKGALFMFILVEPEYDKAKYNNEQENCCAVIDHVVKY